MPSSEEPSREDSITDLKDLLRDQLRDLYSVETQLIPAFHELELLSPSATLRACMRENRETSERHQERLEDIGRARGWNLSGDTSKAMKGLIEGGHAHIASVEQSSARDLLIIAHTHRVKHYEMAAYHIVLMLSEQLGDEAEKRALQASLDEEQALDRALIKFAIDTVLDQIPND